MFYDFPFIVSPPSPVVVRHEHDGDTTDSLFNPI